MAEINSTDALDIFAAASWFNDQWNSTARAVSPERLEWTCSAWGSGEGNAYWEETAVHDVVVARFGLEVTSNDRGRDELIVSVPLTLAPAIIKLIERLDGDEPSMWPWMETEENDDRTAQIVAAAGVLELAPEELAGDAELLRVLRIDN